MSRYREHLENYLKNLDIKSKSVLDVGGASNPVSHRVHSWEVLQYDFLDNELEPSKIDNIRYRVDLNHQKNTVGFAQYTTIFCLEVFEYIFDPMNALRILNELLFEKGNLIITFPTVYPVHEPAESDYLRYTKFGVIRLLEENGFQIVNMISRIMKDPTAYMPHVNAEGYRAKGAMRTATIFDSGYIVEATKL